MADAIYAPAGLAIFLSVLIPFRSFNHETLPGTARLDPSKPFKKSIHPMDRPTLLFPCRDRAVVGFSAGRRRADQPRSVTKIASQ
jgi:hypothetical protein